MRYFVFWTLSRSHHADVGAPEPSTYLPYAAEVYQEGVHFPCVRTHRNCIVSSTMVLCGSSGSSATALS